MSWTPRLLPRESRSCSLRVTHVSRAWLISAKMMRTLMANMLTPWFTRALPVTTMIRLGSTLSPSTPSKTTLARFCLNASSDSLAKSDNVPTSVMPIDATVIHAPPGNSGGGSGGGDKGKGGDGGGGDAIVYCMHGANVSVFQPVWKAEVWAQARGQTCVTRPLTVECALLAYT